MIRFVFLHIIFGLVMQNLTPVFAKDNDESCAQCHSDVATTWASSHHANSMAKADDKSVQGDFSGTSITHHGQTAVFSKKDGDFIVSMSDAGHGEQIYVVAYSFGISPLQQYLVEVEKGQYQVLPFAWDARKLSDGGQRWYHIYPDETLPPDDRLHWRQPLQNWNGMCADCHSTGLKRNYNPSNDTFKTIFDTVNVSCSSCHAGAAEHAKARVTSPNMADGWKDSFLIEKGAFIREEGHNTARWTGKEPRRQTGMQVCAACHSRRGPLTDGIDPAKNYLDQFSPSLLDEELYFADGQIQSEVYVWGSFNQSKMFKSGVACSDCHDSHSLKIKFDGNDLCGQCHAPQVFDTPKHHQHKSSTDGAMCVSCHMPERTYMGVDPRRDHSFKVPRPDISISVGSPNACVTCHSEKKNSWAATWLKEWFPNSKHTGREANVIHEARKGSPLSRAGLSKLIEDVDQPAITRATALSLIPAIADERLVSVARTALTNDAPLIRMGAVRAMAVLAPLERLQVLEALLEDKVRAVRVEAARILLDVSEARIFEKAFYELGQFNKQASWRGEGRANIAVEHEHMGDISTAEKEYRNSILIDPGFAPAIINLSDLLRRSGRDKEAFDLLKKAVSASNVDPAVYHAFGLALVRERNRGEGLLMLKKAMVQARNNARYAYVYLVALSSMNKEDLAYSGIKSVLRRHAYDTNILNFGLSLALKRQDIDFARKCLKTLLEIDPNHQELVRLNAQLGA